MAKRKEKPVEEEVKSTTCGNREEWLKAVKKKFGDVIVDADIGSGKHDKIISISPAIDEITTGGFKECSWIGLTGPPKFGKSSLAYEIAKACQRPENGSRKVAYFKIEDRVHEHAFANLDPELLEVVETRDGVVLTGENHLELAEGFIKHTPGGVVILDSVSALCGKAEMEAELSDQQVALVARLLSKFTRRIKSFVKANRCIVIVISHMISDIKTGFATEKSSNMSKYMYDYMLRAISKSPWEIGGKTRGIITKWICNTSRTGPPFMEGDAHFKFGLGMDVLFESIKFGVALGLIDLSGSWYTMPFLEGVAEEMPKAVQGADKLYDFLKEKPEWAKLLQQKVRELMGY